MRVGGRQGPDGKCFRNQMRYKERDKNLKQGRRVVHNIVQGIGCQHNSRYNYLDGCLDGKKNNLDELEGES